jgi:hypothetical protein
MSGRNMRLSKSCVMSKSQGTLGDHELNARTRVRAVHETATCVMCQSSECFRVVWQAEETDVVQLEVRSDPWLRVMSLSV